MRVHLAHAFVSILLVPAIAGAAPDADTVKVFVLAGQSNMEGKAKNTLLDHQAADPKTKDLFAHLRTDGEWIVQEVFMKMPFVIGVMGQNQSEPAKGAMLAVQEAQPSMEKIPGFMGNVRALRTDVLVDQAGEALYPKWRDNFEGWEKTGSDFGDHYIGSAIWFNRMGKAFGKAMLEMLGKGWRRVKKTRGPGGISRFRSAS